VAAHRFDVFVEVGLRRPALEQRQRVRVVRRPEQLVLLAALFLVGDLLERQEGVREVLCLARDGLEGDDETDGYAVLLYR
jgi:hypothetical protein